MRASADDMLVIAKSRACSLVERSSSPAISRSAVFMNRNGLPEAHPAREVCSSLLVDAVWRPRALTSLNSLAYCVLVKAGGGSTRSWLPLVSENGSILRSQAKTLLESGTTVTHFPGASLMVNR